jgi:hypothetical protein
MGEILVAYRSVSYYLVISFVRYLRAVVNTVIKFQLPKITNPF